MRRAIALAALLGLAGCESFSWNKYDPRGPETPDEVGAAADARAEMQRRCGPMNGEIRQKDDTNGAHTGDWECPQDRPPR